MWRLEFDVQHGVLLLLRNRWSEAESHFRGVLRVAAVSPDIELSAAQGLGHALLSKGELEEARAWFEQALATFGSLPPSTFVGGEGFHLELRGNLAYAKVMTGDLQGAAQDSRRLIDDLASGGERPALVTLLTSLASYEPHLGQVESALVHARRAVEIAERLLDPTHPNRLTAINNLASVLSAAGRVEEAIELQRAVLEGRLARFGPRDEFTGLAMHNLAYHLGQLGRVDEARPLAADALDTLIGAVGEMHEHTAGAYRTLGGLELRAGAARAALELFERSLSILEQIEGDHGADIEYLRERRDEAARASGL